MKVLTEFAGQNWLITPAALAAGEPPPATIHDQKFLLVLTGVVMANLEGNSGSDWLRETLSFLPDMAGPQNSGPLNWAIGRFGIPRPAGQNVRVGFALEEWAPFASLSSMFNENQSINSGFAVDSWRPTHFATGTDAFTHQPVGNIFAGINVDVAVRDTDAWLYRVGYSITLLGRIVFLTVPKTLFESDFDPTPAGSPPSPVQAVGAAKVEGPPRSVIVIEPPFPHTNRWVRITGRANGQEIASLRGMLTEVDGDGVYKFSSQVFMPTGTGVASFSFETAVAEEFMHIDFTPQNQVRIDDLVIAGSFVRDQIILLEATLTIAPGQSTAHVVLSGGAAGNFLYTMPAPFQILSRQFGAIRLWQGVGDTGGFDATDIVVTRES